MRNLFLKINSYIKTHKRNCIIVLITFLALLYGGLIAIMILTVNSDNKLTQYTVTACLGTTAFVFIMFAIWPQFVRVVKTHDTQSIALWMYILYILGDAAWIIFDGGFIKEITINFHNGYYQNTPLWLIVFPQVLSIISNSIGVGIGIYIVFRKSLNLWHAKQNHMSEREYSESTQKQRSNK